LTARPDVRSFTNVVCRMYTKKERSLPVFRFSRDFGVARKVKVFLGLEGGITRAAPPEENRREDRTRNPRPDRKRAAPLKRSLEERRRELSGMMEELREAKRTAKKPERVEHLRRVKSKKQEMFRLRAELNAVEERPEAGPETGALPDFVVVGAPKCGTTFLYHLLAKHPYVEPAAFKELHYFDLLFDKGTEWYRHCFPSPRRKNGRKIITGEGTPGYLFHPQAAKRMARVIPDAKLIALLRNPVDRTYSAYHHRTRNRDRVRTFEETVRDNFDAPNQGFLSQSIYVDHLLRWSEYFDREQMLVLKSEDFFELPRESLRCVLEYLDLPNWEPEAAELRSKLNKGGYGHRMDSATRERLEKYFEPHNQRLYEYLGVDFGW
jgi:hypothetical protein